MSKIVLITGASSGIGRATALKFAQEGYRLILCARRKDRLEAVANTIRTEYKTPVITRVLDVRHMNSCLQTIQKFDDEWESVDLLINNAGLAKGFAPIQDGNLNHWNEMIDTNIKGVLHMTKAISSGMVSRKRGHIINLCSIAGKEVYPNGNVYCATKHAVDALTKAMRIDLYQHGIKVSQISPAHVEENEFSLVRFDGDQEKAKIYEDFNPLRSEDVAESIFFMASQPAHVNIQDIVILGTQQASASLVDRSGRKYD